MWMPGWLVRISDTPMWMSAVLKKLDPNQPIVYAPIAKNAT